MFTYTEAIPYLLKLMKAFPAVSWAPSGSCCNGMTSGVVVQGLVGKELAALGINLSLNARNCQVRGHACCSRTISLGLLRCAAYRGWFCRWHWCV